MNIALSSYSRLFKRNQYFCYSFVLLKLDVGAQLFVGVVRKLKLMVDFDNVFTDILLVIVFLIFGSMLY